MKIDLIDKLPNKLFNIVKTFSTIADREGFRIYIVGGPVRDLLLNVSNYDLDFVVEGDGVRFAELVGKEFKSDVQIYKPFNTATIIVHTKRIDIVTARKETYKKPSAYPDITPSSIKDDLYRRDFTINAMAIGINKNNFGGLVDYYNGFKDLKKGVIRIMHDKSFIDDPTRIFRAVRFGTRFDFKIEPLTMSLMKKAILDGYLGKVNRGRIRKEVEFFLNEKSPVKCLKMFEELV